MRLLMHAVIPHEPFNTLLRNGTAAATIGRIMESIKPESAYFTTHLGQRCVVLVVNVNDASEIPAITEPLFLSFNADCDFSIAMKAEDLQKAGIDEIAKQWG